MFEEMYFAAFAILGAAFWLLILVSAIIAVWEMGWSSIWPVPVLGPHPLIPSHHTTQRGARSARRVWIGVAGFLAVIAVCAVGSLLLRFMGVL
jgi:hypothetical protein